MRRLPSQILSGLALIAALGLSGCDKARLESDRRLAVGVEAVLNGQVSDAIVFIEEAIALDASNAQAHLYLGRILSHHQRDLGDALEHLELASLDEEYAAEAFYELGKLQSGGGDPFAAVESFETSTRIDGSSAAAWWRLGGTQEQLGRYEDAIDSYTRAIYADPTYTIAFHSLGLLYLRFERPQEASQVFANAIENEDTTDSAMAPARMDVRASLGLSYLELDQASIGLRYLREAAELSNSSFSVIYNLAVLLRENGDDREEALEYARLAGSRCVRSQHGSRCDAVAALIRELEQRR